MTRYRYVVDASLGPKADPEIVEITGQELIALEAQDAIGAAIHQAEIDAESSAMAARRDRRTLMQSLGPYATPTWGQVAAHLTKAIEHEQRPAAQWTNVLIIDAIKVLLRMALFLVARELRRVANNREPD